MVRAHVEFRDGTRPFEKPLRGSDRPILFNGTTRASSRPRQQCRPGSPRPEEEAPARRCLSRNEAARPLREAFRAPRARHAGRHQPRPQERPQGGPARRPSAQRQARRKGRRTLGLRPNFRRSGRRLLEAMRTRPARHDLGYFPVQRRRRGPDGPPPFSHGWIEADALGAFRRGRDLHDRYRETPAGLVAFPHANGLDLRIGPDICNVINGRMR